MNLSSLDDLDKEQLKMLARILKWYNKQPKGLRKEIIVALEKKSRAI